MSLALVSEMYAVLAGAVGLFCSVFSSKGGGVISYSTESANCSKESSIAQPPAIRHSSDRMSAVSKFPDCAIAVINDIPTTRPTFAPVLPYSDCTEFFYAIK
ncbi:MULTISPECIES: hypothetical protein [unclassified Nostoc]|uniref:hypothetical protein n=1 Tax=unclassified Nostoc TaxID=2593658 RepID=UPI002ADC63DE|nr:hypothetical protein [Nostoc sp. DedQUE02]